MIPSMFGGSYKFLKVTDVGTGDLVKFIDGGEEVESTKFTYPALTQAGTPHPFAGKPKKQFNISVELGGGDKKTMSINQTSFNQLADKWGKDTSEWIGKIAEVTLVPLPNGRKMISLTPQED